MRKPAFCIFENKDADQVDVCGTVSSMLSSLDLTH